MIQVWKRQCVSRIQEQYDNIAVVVLGTLDITAEDEEYIKVGNWQVQSRGGNLCGMDKGLR